MSEGESKGESNNKGAGPKVGKDNIFVQSAIDRAREIAEQTGQSVEEILKQERAESLERHAQMITDGKLSDTTAEGSAKFWQKVYNTALRIIKRK